MKISEGKKKWIKENKNTFIAGLKKGLFNSRKKLPNKFEQRLYNILKVENIEFIPQYELGGKFYDAYLPDYNTLIEFDGNFWHKDTLEECIYPIQKRNLKNDKRKDFIAKVNGYKLIRIKELDYITSIKQLLE